MLLKKTSLNQIIKRTITVSPQTSLLSAREKLLRHNLKRLVVVDSKNHPIGIITEKDIAKSVSVYSERPIAKIILGDIMSKDLITLGDSATIHDCAKKMIDNGISSVIIKNPRGQLVGVVTKTDLVSAFLIQSTASLPISKIMTKKVITVSPDDSIFEAQSMLVNNKIGRLIVVRNKKTVGVITYRDFVPAKTFDLHRQFVDPSERAEVAWSKTLNEFNVNQLSYLLTFSAKDIMTAEPYNVEPSDAVYTAAIIMIRHGISGIPVTKKGKLVGLVTKTDIVNVLAKKGKLK